jgi:putative DNA primase/helicase
MKFLKQALEYASIGWAVFPVHGVVDGSCTCGKHECSSPGKHPIYAGGFKIATTDPEQIKAWWSTPPWANIGIATGRISNLLVIDIDTGEGKDGFASLQELEREYGPLPQSRRVCTGSGGRHIYFQMPDKPINGTVGALGHAIDIRAEGGYVVAPPSRHISGNNYEWETPND